MFPRMFRDGAGGFLSFLPLLPQVQACPRKSGDRNPCLFSKTNTWIPVFTCLPQASGNDKIEMGKGAKRTLFSNYFANKLFLFDDWKPRLLPGCYASLDDLGVLIPIYLAA